MSNKDLSELKNLQIATQIDLRKPEEILDQAGTDFIIKESKLAHTIYKRGN